MCCWHFTIFTGALRNIGFEKGVSALGSERKRKVAKKMYFLTFPAYFYIPVIFSNLNFYSSNSLGMRNLQEQVQKQSLTKNCYDLSLFE